YTLAFAEQNVDSIFSAIREKRIQVVSEPLSIREALCLGVEFRVCSWAVDVKRILQSKNKRIRKSALVEDTTQV
ncbi:MAG: hypothetical protein ABH878_00490, partial [bacterium]